MAPWCVGSFCTCGRGRQSSVGAGSTVPSTHAAGSGRRHGIAIPPASTLCMLCLHSRGLKWLQVQSPALRWCDTLCAPCVVPLAFECPPQANALCSCTSHTANMVFHHPAIQAMKAIQAYACEIACTKHVRLMHCYTGNLLRALGAVLPQSEPTLPPCRI
jgi:hypothetical protein